MRQIWTTHDPTFFPPSHPSKSPPQPYLESAAMIGATAPPGPVAFVTSLKTWRALLHGVNKFVLNQHYLDVLLEVSNDR